MTQAARLALGAAQFGMPYGVSNRRGQPDAQTVTAILAYALERDINMIDTASAYGESEAVIGSSLRALNRHCALVTKTPSFGGQGVDSAELAATRAAFDRSLQRLRADSVYALLLHHAGDLCGRGAALLAELMLEIKASGRAKKIGVSVYEPWEVDAALARLAVDVVQVPLNVFDQRFVRDGTLRRLNEAGVEVHCRSVFLQGVLLMSPDKLPTHLRPVEPRLSRFCAAASQAGSTNLAAALAFVRSAAAVDRLIVGVTSVEELQEIASAFAAKAPVDLDFSALASEDLDMIDPRRWPKLQ